MRRRRKARPRHSHRIVPARPATQVPNRAMPANPPITISGCLKEEKDVPALKPSAVEKAGITDDYVLTDVKMSPSSSVSGIGISTRYEIEGIAEAELKKHVEPSGRADGPDRAGSPRAPLPTTRRISRRRHSRCWRPPVAPRSSAQRLIKRTPKTGVTSRPPVASKRTVSFSLCRISSAGITYSLS